jgi:tetratricopeptide (TPR) repeat protein
MHRAVIIGIAALRAAAVAAPAANEARLQQSVTLPTVDLTLETHWSLADLEKLLEQRRDRLAPAQEAAVLTRSMKGNSGDAERYQRLGQLYRQLNDQDRAKRADQRAALLFRQRLKARPGDSHLLTRLGELLTNLERPAEAEKMLRQAVRISPKAWTAWAALGELLQTRAFQTLNPRSTAGEFVLGVPRTEGNALPDPWLEELLAARPGAEPLQRAQKLHDEERTCFNRAVRAAPMEPRPYFRRASSRPGSAMLQALITALREGETRPKVLGDRMGRQAVEALSSPPFVQDLLQITRLRPQDTRLIAVTSLLAVTFYLTGSGQQSALAAGGAGKVLPESLRDMTRRSMELLQKAMGGPDTRAAAEAAEQLGTLQYMLSGDPQRGEASFERATRLDPSREQSWDMRVVARMRPGEEAELVRLCEERLKLRDTSRNRLLLAKAYVKQDRLEEAAKQARAMVRLAPSAFTANLTMAAILMKGPLNAATLTEAGQFLQRARKAPGQTPDQQLDLRLDEAIHTALSGDRVEAHRLLGELVRQQPEYSKAREALTALEGEF